MQQRYDVTSPTMFCDKNDRSHSLFDMTDRRVTCFSKLNAQDAERVKTGCLVE